MTPPPSHFFQSTQITKSEQMQIANASLFHESQQCAFRLKSSRAENFMANLYSPAAKLNISLTLSALKASSGCHLGSHKLRQNSLPNLELQEIEYNFSCWISTTATETGAVASVWPSHHWRGELPVLGPLSGAAKPGTVWEGVKARFHICCCCCCFI